MSIYSQADNEVDNLHEQLVAGEITLKEYNEMVRQIQRDVADYEGEYNC